jgi:hypothetical protein
MERPGHKRFPGASQAGCGCALAGSAGDWTCSIATFRGTMKGPMVMADGTEVPPTGKSFEVDFYTIAKWHDGQIVEENLMYDLVGFLQQIGLGK